MDAANFLKYYYFFKPMIPRSIQILLRRCLVARKLRSCSDVWPIDMKSATPPDGWEGWPDGKRFALVLTHDVDTAAGVAKCRDLMRLEQEMGFRSSFNFVPGDYQLDPGLRAELIENGFEVGVHGWTHDGSLYRSRKIFLEQARKINAYLRQWEAVGFRSPAMHHNLEWIGDLDIEYDLSTFDTDPFEPQSNGMRTIFPFRVAGNGATKGYIELPYTLPQDFTLYILMAEKGIDIWKKKLDWITEKGGMGLLNVHPDYMSFNGRIQGREEYPSGHYADFLAHAKGYGEQCWNVLPRELAHFWATTFRS